MTTNEALAFLRTHQPLPPSKETSEALLKTFDDVRKHFKSQPDNRCVPLFLNSFGEGDGHGVYQLVEDTLLAHPEEVVIRELMRSLRSPASSVRYWSAEIAAPYRRPELIGPLAELLHHDNPDERAAATIALELIGTPEALRHLDSKR